jgi:hypothetical protein
MSIDLHFIELHSVYNIVDCRYSSLRWKYDRIRRSTQTLVVHTPLASSLTHSVTSTVTNYNKHSHLIYSNHQHCAAMNCVMQ